MLQTIRLVLFRYCLERRITFFEDFFLGDLRAFFAVLRDFFAVLLYLRTRFPYNNGGLPYAYGSLGLTGGGGGGGCGTIAAVEASKLIFLPITNIFFIQKKLLEAKSFFKGMRNQVKVN